MEKFIGYLPIDRRFAIACGEGLADQSQGTALIVEISGLHTLAKGLVVLKRGENRENNDLSLKLDHAFEKIIQAVHAYHGSIVHFSGDSLTCWFDGDTGVRALSAASKMDEQINKGNHLLQIGAQLFGLSLKAAVAAGQSRRFLVGDPSIQYMDLLAGPAVQTASLLVEAADYGQIMVSSEVYEALNSDLTLSGTGFLVEGIPYGVVEHFDSKEPLSPWPLVVRGFKKSDLRPWLPAPLYTRFLTNQDPDFPEEREIAAISMSFKGVDVNTGQDAGRQIDQTIRWVQNVVNRHSGCLLQVHLENDGGYLCATFGAPNPHADDPELAVTAALELLSPPRVLGLQLDIKIGISRGRVCTGSYGSLERRTYAMLCDQPHTARELMNQALSGQILVTDTLLSGSKNRQASETAGEEQLAYSGPNGGLRMAQIHQPRPGHAINLVKDKSDGSYGVSYLNSARAQTVAAAD